MNILKLLPFLAIVASISPLSVYAGQSSSPGNMQDNCGQDGWGNGCQMTPPGPSNSNSNSNSNWNTNNNWNSQNQHQSQNQIATGGNATGGNSVANGGNNSQALNSTNVVNTPLQLPSVAPAGCGTRPSLYAGVTGQTGNNAIIGNPFGFGLGAAFPMGRESKDCQPPVNNYITNNYVTTPPAPIPTPVTFIRTKVIEHRIYIQAPEVTCANVSPAEIHGLVAREKYMMRHRLGETSTQELTHIRHQLDKVCNQNMVSRLMDDNGSFLP